MDYSLRVTDGLDEDSGEVYLVLHISSSANFGNKELQRVGNIDHRVRFSAGLEINDSNIIDLLIDSALQSEHSDTKENAEMFFKVATEVWDYGLNYMLQS